MQLTCVDCGARVNHNGAVDPPYWVREVSLRNMALTTRARCPGCELKRLQNLQSQVRAHNDLMPGLDNYIVALTRFLEVARPV